MIQVLINNQKYKNFNNHQLEEIKLNNKKIFLIKLKKKYGRNKNNGIFKIKKRFFLISFLLRKRFKIKINKLEQAIMLNNFAAISSIRSAPKKGLNKKTVKQIK